jgi:hypothetical protein
MTRASVDLRMPNKLMDHTIVAKILTVEYFTFTLNNC